MREGVKALVREYNKTEDDLKALQVGSDHRLIALHWKGNGANLKIFVDEMKSVGQIIGEVLRQLDDDRFIVKASSGPRYVVGCRSKVRRAMQQIGVMRRR